ncbi:YkvA family protein [Mesorhizobium sp. CCNWLW179-1]|uniref:YkvA family protein n=1 Tax=unclassified Mesorhizobium TaxID=325217 RepID=UPI0030147BD5
MGRWLDIAKQWARSIKRDVVALWIAARDPRTPIAAKLVAGAVAAYALSPIDLIPDFIPVLGYLDDLIIVPLGILLAVRLVPEPLMREYREAASAREGRPASVGGLVAIIFVWLVCLGLIMLYIWRQFVR